MPNAPTYQLDATAVAARNAEYTGTPLTDVPGDGTTADPVLGCNKAGSNAPGIGIATDNIDPKVADWTTLDQGQADAGATPLARVPQDSQHLGGSGLAGGTEGLTTVAPIQGVFGIAPDINDTAAFVVADTQAAPGAVFDIASGVVNRGGTQIEIGDRAWGLIPVA